MYDEMGKRLRSLAGMLPQKHTLPSGADTVICSLEAFMQIKELAEEAANALEELSKPRWIPVTERLPRDEKDVLAYYGFKHDGVLSDQRFIGTLCYFRFDPNPHWQHEGQGKLTVTHWMPLQEPPEEEA